ncbi:glycerophosphodiester phosphodiesterase family protein [Thalassospira povalilytica]|uniref:glycerophosphodiester phosphodiesterase family protein n=1 Tax=Thalassospira povalilytica TaxID=732237 RepID=UPI003AA82E87
MKSRHLVTLFGFVTLLLMVTNVSSEITKETLIDFDAKWLNGALRRVYHQQHLPNLPASLPDPDINAYLWLEHKQSRVIRHAMGETSAFPRNSLKALMNSIANGDMIIEGDIRLTTEGDLICFHGDETKSVSTAEYLALKKSLGETPCFFLDVVQTLRSHPNVYFIVDAKDNFVETYSKIEKIAEDVLIQIIPQIYDFEQIIWVRNHKFSGAVFTSYKSALTNEQIFHYANAAKIQAVTLTKERTRKLETIPQTPFVFTHTIDAASEAEVFFKLGIKGVYSNSLPAFFSSQK